MTTSWVIVEKATGEAVLETFNPEAVRRLNTEKYDAAPIAKYLGELNKRIREASHGESSP